MQEQRRIGWRENAARDERVEQLSQRERKRGMLDALLLFGTTELLSFGWDWRHLAVAALLALVAGEIWWRMRAGQLGTALVATIGFGSVQVAWFCSGESNVLTFLCSSAFVAFASIYLGLRREERTGE